jgi:hypothetical protein
MTWKVETKVLLNKLIGGIFSKTIFLGILLSPALPAPQQAL